MSSISKARRLLHTVSAVAIGSVAVAQSPRWERVDGPSNVTAAFDSTRTRLVALDALGTTYEWSGAWHRMPAEGPVGFATQLVHDPLRRFTFALGNTFLSQYDGIAWTPFPPPVPVATIRGLAFDLGRGRLVALASGGTWEHDGTSWVRTIAAGSPSTSAVTFDSRRQRIVALAQGGVLEAYDGVSWTAISLPGPPPLPVLGFDPTTGALVVRGDDYSMFDWVWDGTNWSISFQQFFGPQSLCSTPFGLLTIAGHSASVALHTSLGWLEIAPADHTRAWGGLALDPQSSQMSALGDGALLHWDGTRWLSTADPSGRLVFGLVHDNLRSRLVGIGAFGDVAVWSGTAWQQVTAPPAAFSPRDGAAYVYDPARDRVLVYGGLVRDAQFNQVPTSELWSWDGANWQQLWISTVGWPVPRRSAGMTFDPIRQKVLLAGGVGSSGNLADTWEWNGTSWTQLSPQAAPFAGAIAMVFDLQLGRPLAAKVRGTTVDLYAHDGANWSLSSSEPGVGANVAGQPFTLQMAPEPGTGRLLLMDGGGLLRRTSRPGRVEVQAAGCGSPIRLASREVPHVGAPASGCDVYGAPGPVLLGLGATAATAPLGGGCDLLLGSIDMTFLLGADANGFATQQLSVPTLPALVGVTVYAQAAQLDAGSPIGLAVSARLAQTIGD